LMSYRNRGQTPVVIHLGDHDPSGLDMTRDIQERLDLFSEGSVDVRRVALNMDQVKKFKPPPNPTKLTDSRAEGYLKEHGNESWELDALDPATIESVITKEVEKWVDLNRFEARQKIAGKMRKNLDNIVDQWDKVVKRFGKKQAKKRKK